MEDALGLILPDVANEAGRAGGRSHDAEFDGDLPRQRAGVLKPRHDRGRVPDQIDGPGGLPVRLVQPSQDFGGERIVDVEANAAGPDHPASKSAAAQQGRHVQEVAANASAVTGGGQEAHVARDRAKIADVVGQAFEFEGDAAERLGAS